MNEYAPSVEKKKTKADSEPAKFMMFISIEFKKHMF